MNKRKARVCTIFFSIVLIGAMVGTLFIKGTGCSLYQIVTSCISAMWIGNCIDRFYKWLVKD